MQSTWVCRCARMRFCLGQFQEMILSMAPVLLAAMAVADPLCYWKENGFPELVFQKLSCALCYHYMHYSNFVPGTKAPQVKGVYLLVQNATVEANATAPDEKLLETFASSSAAQNWIDCCRKAAECCTELKNANASSSWCPWTWDGWSCWPPTPPSTAKELPCPPYIRFGTTEFDCSLKVKKYCGAEGIWFGHPTNLTVQWTDYSTCSLHGVMEHRLYIGVITHIISTVLLLPALVIFSVYRQLHGQRILLHKNLFASLLFNAVFEICFKTGILLTANEHDQDSVLKQNAVHCRLLLMLIKYFRLTNYIWMFCEGFYLHRMIAAAFPEEWNPRLFYVIGWGFPLLPALVYAVLRVSYFDENCWILPADTIEWVLNAPSLLSLIANVFFLVDIIRILVMKLRGPHHLDSAQYSKAVKAVVVLVPLFGLHYVITVYRPQTGSCQWPEVYIYLNILLDGLQGAIVSLTFCYINGEVLALMHRSYQNFMEQRNPGSSNTRQYVGCNTTTTMHTAL